MFKNDYQNAMNSIKADNAVKNNIRATLCGESENKKNRNPAVPWRIGFAVCTCIAVALSVILIPSKKNKPSVAPGDIDRAYLAPTKSYDEVYETFKELSERYDDVTDEIILYEYAAEEAADDMDGAATGGGTKGSATYSSANGIENYSSSTSGTVSAQTDTAAREDMTSKTEDENEYSSTTTQIEGVDEADIVKTDGEYIYYLYNNCLRIVKANGRQSRLIHTLTLPDSSEKSYTDMYICGDRLSIIASSYENQKCTTDITVYDISNRESLKTVGVCTQSGDYLSSRMIGNFVYLITNHYVDLGGIVKDKPETYVPYTECDGTKELIPADCIMSYECGIENSVYLIACVFDVNDASLSGESSLLGGADRTYCNTEYLVTARTGWSSDESSSGNYSLISSFALGEGKIEYKASGEVAGYLEDQFSMDEYGGNFRFVTTVNTHTTSTHTVNNKSYVSRSSAQCAQLTVLDNNLKELGKIENLAEGEKVYSVRFMGDIAYFVTFRQTDPLFSADLSDPQNPKIIGELKIPGFSEFLFPYGEGRLLGIGQDADESTGRTNGLKLSMFNISDSSNVTETDKTVLPEIDYSVALSNHKAVLVNYDKNLIGFAATESAHYVTKLYYYIYSFSGGVFELKGKLPISSYASDMWTAAENTRALYINNCFYLVSPGELLIYNLSDFTQLSSVNF